MHPQLSPVAAHMRLAELASRRHRRPAIVPTLRRPAPFGLRRWASRSPSTPVAPVVALPACRAGCEAARDQRVA